MTINYDWYTTNYGHAAVDRLTLFLAPLALGQRPYVMVCCHACVRALTFSLNIFFSETTYRILMKFQECSCHGPLQNFLKEFNSIKNSGAMATKHKNF